MDKEFEKQLDFDSDTFEDMNFMQMMDTATRSRERSSDYEYLRKDVE